MDLLILGIGVSEYKNDGVLRFEHFCKSFGLQYKIVGEGHVWRGGDMAKNPGGGQKINELKMVLETMTDNRLIIVCDTFDLFPIACEQEILNKYHTLCHPNKIIFSSEIYCWPDKSLSNSYPESKSKYRYLCSGSFMGYRDTIYDLIKNDTVKDDDDDQLFFTKKFLEGNNIVLDYGCELFQALNGTEYDIIIHKNRIYNKETNTYPVFIHGNGFSKFFLNTIENYIQTDMFSDHSFTLKKYDSTNSTKIFIALYIDSQNYSVFEECFSHLVDLEYTNKEVYVYDRSENEDTKYLVELAGYVYKPNIFNYLYDDFLNSDAEYYFLLEQQYVITNKNIIQNLLSYMSESKRIISPMGRKKNNNLYTNFWGEIDDNGYYKRSHDYFRIANYEIRGLWNVPYVTGAILMHRDIIKYNNLSKANKFEDIDMQLCYNLRNYTLFMYVVNYNDYGFIVGS